MSLRCNNTTITNLTANGTNCNYALAGKNSSTTPSAYGWQYVFAKNNDAAEITGGSVLSSSPALQRVVLSYPKNSWNSHLHFVLCFNGNTCGNNTTSAYWLDVIIPAGGAGGTSVKFGPSANKENNVGVHISSIAVSSTSSAITVTITFAGNIIFSGNPVLIKSFKRNYL